MSEKTQTAINEKNTIFIVSIGILHLVTLIIVNYYIGRGEDDVTLVYLIANLVICNIIWLFISPKRIKNWTFLSMVLFQMNSFWYACLKQGYN